MVEEHLKVIILPTEEKTKVLKVYSDIDKEDFKLLYNRPKNDEYKEYQHLYVLEPNPSQLKEGDWYFDEAEWKEHLMYPNNTYFKWIVQEGKDFNEQKSYRKKIIATTNEELLIEDWYESIDLGMQCKYISLPKPSNEFLEKFCELGGIDKVLVEYEELYKGLKEIKLKIALDNTITIYPL